MALADRTEASRLLAAIARGDQASFRRLYDMAAPKLFGLTLRMIRNRPAAEDALQDVFLRIWSRAASYTPESGDAFAWMAQIARNRAIDYLRAQPAARRADVDAGETLDALPELRDREGEMMNAAILRHCLSVLDATTRACVVDAYCLGLSREELAERHTAPVNTIKTWLRRGLAALKSCMDRDG